MRRVIAVLIFGIVTACTNLGPTSTESPDSTIETTQASASVSVTPLSEPSTTSRATTSIPPPDESLSTEAGIYRVVLVPHDDTLNVRQSPGMDGEVIDRLPPGSEVRATGDSTQVGGSTWLEVEGSTGTGWVNGYYLTPSQSLSDLTQIQHPHDVLAEFARRLRLREDFSDLVSWRGLHISFYDDPIRYAPSEIADLYVDPTPIWMESPAMTEEEVRDYEPTTFQKAVVESFLEVFYSAHIELSTESLPDTVWTPQRDIHFAGFPFVTVYAEVDIEGVNAIDGWVLALSWEEGEVKIVGLTEYSLGPN